MSDLLKRSRKINHLLQKAGSRTVKFPEMADILEETIKSNIYIADTQGNILGYSLLEDFECEVLHNEILKEEEFPPEYNNILLKTAEIQRNIKKDKEGCIFNEKANCLYENKLTTIVPIFGGGKRLGTLVLARYKDDFTDHDLFLAEYGSSVVGMEIMRSQNNEIEREIRDKTEVQIAVDTLSYSELEAVEHIFDKLDGKEGLLVASKIADKIGITRSVIVNALRKLESSGVIESRSLGMKGTHIKVLNDYLLDEIDDI